MTRIWTWAFGPNSEGFALLCAIVAAASVYLLAAGAVVAAAWALVAALG